MLSRYQVVRGQPLAALPSGRRMDTRKHTRHLLRPDSASVARLLVKPSDEAFEQFRKEYLATLRSRFEVERARFDELAALAFADDVYLGCNCPTKRQPLVSRCHTWLALEFMQRAYPDLTVVFPATADM